jgi:tetratricopeptide (TPR) repeat protein
VKRPRIFDAHVSRHYIPIGARFQAQVVGLDRTTGRQIRRAWYSAADRRFTRVPDALHPPAAALHCPAITGSLVTDASTLLQDALALHRRGDLAGAIERYERLVRDNADHTDALFYLAMAAYAQGRAADAVRLGRRAAAAGRNDARLHDLIGSALRAIGDREAALASFDRALALQSDFAVAHGNRGNVLAELGRLDEAMAAFDRAVALDPNSPDDWLNRGATLHDLDRFDEAVESYDRALALNPNIAGAHYNRGNVLRDLAQLAAARGERPDALFDAALESHSRAIALAPQYPDPHFGRALIHLLRGNWDTGWSEYEYRAQVGQPNFVALNFPLWRGEPLRSGERLVLLTEQGLGDIMFFCRFAPLIAARGFDVTILTRAAMAPLLSALPGVRIVTSAEALASDPRPIRWLPLMSVAGALGINAATIPASVPYLAAEPARIDAWAKRLGGGFKIGINWGSGHAATRHFTKRNIPLAAFAPLAALPGVRLIALQKGDAAAEIERVDFGDRIERIDADPDPDANFFLDTAAVMTRLHLVVTCDTSVAHLAGSLARPVFTALPAIADWRWLIGRDDSPWYPTMRLFRQRRLGDWSDVMARIADAARERMPK